MASIGHTIVGLAAARLADPVRPPRQRVAHALAWVALSNLPDLDVLAFKLGIPYYSPWGHRGASHSLLAAVAIGLTWGWLLARDADLARWRTCILAVCVSVSHVVLDAMTDGGLGVAAAWPITDHRYFLPWRPLPVAPIGWANFSMLNVHVAAVEVIYFLPFILLAAWPRKWRIGATPVSSTPATVDTCAALPTASPPNRPKALPTPNVDR
jgi:inner membrane protein